AMLGSVMNLQLARNPSCFRWIKHFIEHRQGVRVQLIHDQADDVGAGKMYIDQVFEAMGDIQNRAGSRDFDVAPATLGAHEHKQVAGAFALVLVIMSFHLSWRRWNHRAHFTDELVGALVEAYSWTLGILLLGVQVQHVFHMIDKLGTY